MTRRNQLSSQLTLSMKQLTWKIRGLFRPDRAEGNKFALPSTRMGSKSRFYRCAMALYKYKKCWHKLWVWCRYRYIFHSLESAGKAIVIFHWLWLWESLLRGKERKVTSWQMIYCALHLSLRFNTFVHFSSTPSTVVICVFFSRWDSYKWLFGFASSSFQPPRLWKIPFLPFITDCRNILDFVNNE